MHMTAFANRYSTKTNIFRPSKPSKQLNSSLKEKNL